MLTAHAIFAGLLGLLALVEAGSLVDLVGYARTHESASHIVVVPLAAAWLVSLERTRIFASRQPAWGPGAAIMAAGVALVAWARVGWEPPPVVPTVAAAGLVVFTLGAFLAVCGWRAFRAGLFPLLFLAFAIPLPDALLARVIAVLQAGSAEVTWYLFALTGTPVHREGHVFWLPSLAIEVARECSGIRSSTALFLTALVAGQVLLASTAARALLAAAVLPITILKNGIRIVTLSLLAMRVDPSFLTGRLHREGGIVFFAMAILMLLACIVVLRRLEARRRAPAVPATAPAG